MTMPTNLKPDPQLREVLLTFFLETLTSPALGDWLRHLGEDPRGTVQEKRERIRAKTPYLRLPETQFPAHTQDQLKPYPSELLSELCKKLDLCADGTKEQKFRRLMRTVHTREGWLPAISPPISASALSVSTVASILGWFPLSDLGDYEKDYYPIIRDELVEALGDIVFEQLPVAHGSTLKIDFHVGEPHGQGIGVEVKFPQSNADVQRAIGQLEQYQRRYGANLVLLILQGLAKREVMSYFLESLKSRGIAVVVR